MFSLFGTEMRKNMRFFVLLTVFFAPRFVCADTTTTSKQYVDNNFITNVATGTTAGTINVTKGNSTTPVAVNANVVTTNNGTDGYVVNSVAADANTPSQINVTRSYVKIPVAAGAPSTNTPTGFVEVWFE